MNLETTIELAEREIAFVGTLAARKRPTRAAVLAGYSPANAVNLLRRPEIRAALIAVSTNAQAILGELEEHPR